MKIWIKNTSAETKHSDQIDAMCTLRRRGDIFFLTLTGHDEHRFGSTLIKEIQSKLSEVRAYAEPGAVLITTAEGEFFSNGLDLSWPQGYVSHKLRVQIHDLVLSFKPIVDDLFSLPLPTVAAVTGHAAAAGFTFALSHDYVLMSKDKGVLYMSEIDNRLTIPDYFMAVMKSKISSPKAQRELELRAAEVKAEEAVEMGIIDSVHDSPVKTFEAAVCLGEKLASKKWNGEVFAGIRKASFREACNVLGLVVMEEKEKERETMVEPITSIVLEMVLQQVYDESNFVFRLSSELDKMKSKLTKIKSFLTEASKLQSNNRYYSIVKTTFDNLRELVYDADDILLDCQIRAVYLKEVAFLHCGISPCELAFRYRKVREIKKINEKVDQLVNELSTYLHPIMVPMTQKINEECSSSIRWTSPAFSNSVVIGLEEDTKKVLEWILYINGEQNRVGIVGMGGLGKTTIAQKIFNDRHVVDRFEKRIWVTVSQEFDMSEIMKSILNQLGADESRTDQGELLYKILQSLKNKNYLIVFDDVWSTNGWWDQVCSGLPKGDGCNSSIIITTRNEELARHMGVVEGRIHRPKLLSDYESWSLFCKVAFSASKDMRRNFDIEDVGKEIVKKCRGLPLAIKIIGGLLSTKTLSLSEWVRINDDFRDKLLGKGLINASLQLSFDELPDHLKHCILCFSVYPEDCEINAEQLVYWWVGEGFVREKGNKTALELALGCLSELISRFLVEAVEHRGYDGRVYTCKMHDMVRDLIILNAKEHAFCIFDTYNKPKPDRLSRHLGFTSDQMDDKPLENNSKLRALLVMSSCPFRFRQNTGLATVSSLRVLDLSFNKLNGVSIEDLLDWIKSQNRLAHLNLQGVADLKELPNSIIKLRNLQHLVLNGCRNLEKLPPCITTLHKLTVLDIWNCSFLQSLPRGLGKLTNLQELSGFKLSSSRTDGCCLGELKGLTQLRVLRINMTGKEEVVDDELMVLSLLTQLRVLSIDTCECEKQQILQKLDKLSPPPPCLQELYLWHYHGDATPKWINPSSLPELLYLCIENGELARLSSNFSGTEDKPWKIEGLCLKYLPRLKMEWGTVKSIMPLLRYVEVSHCHMLKSFPCEVNYLGVWNKKDAEESEEETILERL